MSNSHQVDASDGEAEEREAEASIIDPSTLYKLDDYLVQQDMLDSFAKEIAVEVKGSLESQALSVGRGPRNYVDRPREAAAEQLVRDYFCDNPIYPSKVFRTRFRMRRPLFERIVHALGEWSPEFTQRRDALDRDGLSPLQKCTSAIRQLAYGTPADALDEYLKIAESTSVKCLIFFCPRCD
jgi:hypothetical protein